MATISQMTTEQRLEKLEKELSRAKRGNRLLLAVMLLAGVIITAGAVTTEAIGRRKKIVEANAFILIDDNGKTRAGLLVTKDGPVLSLYDENGKTRADLLVTKDGPMLRVFDENGKTRAVLAVPKEGPGLALYDENGKTCAGLAVLKDGPGLELVDENGKLRATLGVGKTTTPDGKVISYPESSLLLYKPDGTVLWQAPP